MNITCSTPLGAAVKNFFGGNKPPSDVGSPLFSPVKVKTIKKQTILDLVVEAIATIGVPKKGASYQAIKKWIINKKEEESSSLKYYLKLALKKGIDKGILVRPRRSENIVSVSGFFMLASLKPLKSSKKIAAKIAAKNVRLSGQVKQMNNKASKKPQKIEEAPKTAAAKTVNPTAKALKPTAKTIKPPTKTVNPGAKAAKPVAKTSKPPTKTIKPPTKTVNPGAIAAKPAAKTKADTPAAKAIMKPAEKTIKPAAKTLKTNVEKKKIESVALKGGSKPAAKVSPKRKAPNLTEDNILKTTEDAQSEEGATNFKKLPKKNQENIISKAAKEKENAKHPTKNKAVKNNTEMSNLLKVENAPSKDKKGKPVKERKKLANIDVNSKKKADSTRIIAKTGGTKKTYNSENEIDCSDSEMATKKNRLKALLKSCSSDTELENSKREERKIKKPLRGRKNIY